MYIVEALKCFITYELSEDYLFEARKEKVIQYSSRQKDSLLEAIGSSNIQIIKTATLVMRYLFIRI